MKKHFLSILNPKFFFIILLFITVPSFSFFIYSADAAEMSGYKIDKSSSGGGRVDQIDIISSALNFGATEGIVTIDGVVASVLEGGWNPGWVKGVIVPSQVEGVADVVVTLADGTQLNTGSFVVNPKITSISPSPFYITKEGTELTIYGEGFRELSDCGNSFVSSEDGSIKDFLSWSDTKIVLRMIKNKSIGIGQRHLVIHSCLISSPFSLLVKQAVCDTEEEWACTGWGSCLIGGVKTRTCTQEFACDSVGTPPATTQTCTPACNTDTWSCGDWESCSTYGTQNRICTKTFDCSTANTQSPITSQSCTPSQSNTQTPPTYTQPLCTEDTWSCGDWNSCSPNGIQTRNCKRTYDCPSTETPPPATSKYCQAYNQPQTPSYSNNTPSDGGSSAQPNNTINESSNQDSIIQATVKLICLLNKTSGMQGSGTVIDPKGIILTNRHVVEGTKGCVVGFINNSDDDPSFTEVADIVKLSTDEDIALIKIRNNGNKSFVYSDISNGSVNSKNLGNKIMIFGYPSIGGAKLNYSDGAVSGFGSAKDGMGNYIKTNAAIDHGNSGGGAYLASNGRFIGIPSAGMKGDLSSVGYILSINKIKSWMNGSGLAYNGSGFSNLSSRSIKASSLLKNADISNINILDVSSANVSIYSSKTKTTLLPNNPGTKQIYNRPAFQINNVDEESDVVGYYVYFGTNMKADPVKKGKLIKKPEYIPLTITQKAVYYFIFRAKNKNGNISESVITEYRYKK